YPQLISSTFFFLTNTATTDIYTLSLHDALPIWCNRCSARSPGARSGHPRHGSRRRSDRPADTPLARRLRHRGHCELTSVPGCRRSEEHTSELQSRRDLVCRLLLEKKKKIKKNNQ